MLNAVRFMAAVVVLGVMVPAVSPMLVCSAAAQGSAGYEAPPVMLATEALPPDLVVGPDYRVEDFVYNDGAINKYQVTSTFGRASVQSTALLRLRIGELRGLRRLEQLAATDLYVRARQAAQTGALRDQKRLIVGEPAAGEGPSSGVGTFFGTSASVSGADIAGDVTETAARFDRFKRAFAYAAGFNPYSRFDAVQQNLREFAWNCFAGGVSVEDAFAAIADAPIQPVRVTAFEDAVNRRVRDESPAQLRERNLAMLVAMGVDESVARLLQSQSRYTPIAKTIITEALERMHGVRDRQVFVERGALIEDTAMAQLLQGWAELLAGYHTNIEPARAMLRLGQSPFLLTADGKVVGVFAMDLLVWTPQTARAVDGVTAAVSRLPDVRGRELWFAGSVTPLTRRNLEQRGWKVQEQAAAKLALR
jgi:hypothetical protein